MMFNAAFRMVGALRGGVKPLLYADRCRQPIGAVQRRLMAGRAAHIGVDRDARIEEKHSTEISACLCDRKFSRAHVLRKRAENLLRLLQRNRVALVSGSNSGREHYYRHDGHTQTFHGCLRTAMSGSTKSSHPGHPTEADVV